MRVEGAEPRYVRCSPLRPLLPPRALGSPSASCESPLSLWTRRPRRPFSCVQNVTGPNAASPCRNFPACATPVPRPVPCVRMSLPLPSALQSGPRRPGLSGRQDGGFAPHATPTAQAPGPLARLRVHAPTGVSQGTGTHDPLPCGARSHLGTRRPSPCGANVSEGCPSLGLGLFPLHSWFYGCPFKIE